MTERPSALAGRGIFHAGGTDVTAVTDSKSGMIIIRKNQETSHAETDDKDR
jgi:hypothetical protein